MDIIKITEQVNIGLASLFPHWNEGEISRFTRFLLWFFKDQTALDGNYVIQIPSHLFEYAKRQVDSGKKQWKDIRPGYLRKALENWSSVAQEFKNFYSDDDLRKINSKKKPDLEAIRWIRDSFRVVIPDFDLPSSVDKILNFINHIDRSVKFTSKQVPVWLVMKEVAEELAEESVEVFWEEVELRCLENNIHMSPENWRQMKKRILDRINAQARGSKGMLHMVSAEELALRKLLNVLERLDENSDDQLRSDVNEILSEYALPDAFKDEVFVIVKLVIQKLREPSNSLAGDYDYSKYEEEVDELVSILQDFDQSYFDNILKDTLLTDTSLLVKACLLVLLSILKDLNEEEINILKDWIHA